MQKTVSYFDRNWLIIMSGSFGVGGAIGVVRNVASGDYRRIILGLVIGLLVGKILDVIIKILMRRETKKIEG